MKFLKEYLPPILIKKITGLLYGWSGNYKSWDQAKKKCTGYDNGVIFEKVKSSLLKVKNGLAVYERDSVLFDKIQYSYPLLSALYNIAILKQGNLNVLDFGGSLGSTYFQNKSMLENLSDYKWCIVEQSHFVEEGKTSFADEHLNFYTDINACLKENSPNVILLSSVLQYLEKPYDLISFILSSDIEYIIVDRAPMLRKGNDRITIQKVPSKIYKASYPCWLLNEKKFLEVFLRKYDLVFDDYLNESINISDANYRFFFFRIKSYSSSN